MFEKCTIRVLDACGRWYDNCIVENDYDAIAIAKFYRDCLGYTVQLWKGNKELTNLIESTKFVVKE